MIAQIQPLSSLHLDISLPGDKSIAHRAAIFAAIAEGTSVIQNYPDSADCRATIRCLGQLGIPVQSEKEGTLHIEGKGKFGFNKPEKELDCGNSGTTARLLAGLLAGQPFESILTGDASLRQRPMQRVAQPLSMMGASIQLTNGDFLPMIIRGKPLKGMDYTLPIPSAQVKSALIFAALLADRPSQIRETSPTRDHTERWIRNIRLRRQDQTTVLVIDPHIRIKPFTAEIPGDISTASFLITGGLLIPDSQVILRRVSVNPTRTGFVRYLQQAGAPIRMMNYRNCTEPMADLHIRTWKESFCLPDIQPSMVVSLIDELPVLSILGTRAQNGLTVRGAGELRHKESDRIAAITGNLRRMGIACEEWPDGFRIYPGTLKGAALPSWNDHRIAMSFSVAALIADGETRIESCEWVNISFPAFFDTLGIKTFS